MTKALPAWTFLLLLTLTIVGAAAQTTAPAANGDGLDPYFRSAEPTPGATVANRTPTIRLLFARPEPAPESLSVAMRIDGTEVGELLAEQGTPNRTGIHYAVSVLFALRDGRHNVSVLVTAGDGSTHAAEWSFVVDTTPAAAKAALKPADIALGGLILLGLVALGAGVFALYLWRFRDYSWFKFRIRHPRQRQLLPVYTSVYLSAAATLGAIYWLVSGNNPPRFAPEYLTVAAVFIGFGPFAIDVKRRKIAAHRTERAYSQFLFELADALRGGIDPMKAVIELSKDASGPLAQPLKIAADGLRLGRPFEQVMSTMVKPLNSHLVSRYAALVGEAAKVGGEISSVVHRAARDLDELVKIKEERGRQMTTPVMTMYIAFGVLLWMVKSLMDFAPDLLSTDFASSGLFGEADPNVQRMSLDTLQQRFFHLMLIASLGTGLLIGSFVEGKLRHGLLHAFAMLAAAVVFFRFMVL